MRRNLLIALVLVAAACSSGEASSEVLTESSIPRSTPTTGGTSTQTPPTETVARWLEFVQEEDIEQAAALFDPSPVAADIGYEPPGDVSAFYGRLGWLHEVEECIEERLGPGAVAVNCTFAAVSELHDVLDIEVEELRFIFERGIPTELGVARSGTLVHHELQLYAQENDGEAFKESCSKPGQFGRFWYDGTCAEYLASILPAAREAVAADS